MDLNPNSDHFDSSYEDCQKRSWTALIFSSQKENAIKINFETFMEIFYERIYGLLFNSEQNCAFCSFLYTSPAECRARVKVAVTLLYVLRVLFVTSSSGVAEVFHIRSLNISMSLVSVYSALNYRVRWEYGPPPTGT